MNAIRLIPAGLLFVTACRAITPATAAALPSARSVQDTLGEVVAGDLGGRMDAVVSAAEAAGFSGQVLVAVGGSPVLHKAYGFADAEDRRHMELGTPVGVASISKQFTAATILELEARGRLSLGDSLPSFFDDVPLDKRRITLEHLITHTSGLRSRYSEDFEPASRDLLIRGILETPAAFEPGARWQYSTAGYNLLAAVVERVSGFPHEETMRRLLFEPAGMRSTGFLSFLPDTRSPVSRSYLGWEDRGSPASWPPNWRNYGAGDMVSTAGDLYRWEVALREGRLLSPRARERFLDPLVEVRDGTFYGFGLFFQRPPDGPTVIEHGGDAALGFNGSFLRYPDEDFIIVITCNARTPQGEYLRHALGEDLEALARGAQIEGFPPVRLPSRGDIDQLTGTYRLDGGGYVHVLTDGAHLWLAAGDPESARLLGGATSEAAADFARAEAKTESLLEGLLRGDSTAYHVALTETGKVHFPSYWRDWAGLVDGWGPFRTFHLLGSSALGEDIATRARLGFFRGSVTATYFWQDRARGRLAGTFVGGPDFWPVVALSLAVPVRERSSATALVARHPFRRRTVGVQVRRGTENESPGLVLQVGERDVVAWKTASAGWVPPLR